LIIVEALGKDILIRGRKPNGKRYEKRIRNFRPYFYVPDENGRYMSLFGDRLKKIVLNHPAEVKTERERYEKTFEADVTYINRYLIDNHKEIPKEPIRICFFDIEVDDSNGFPKASEANEKIIALACYDNFTNYYYCFALYEKSGVEKTIIKAPDNETKLTTKIYFFEDEKELLEKFIKFIKVKDFDLIFAWNGDDFDYPYLFNRLKKLGLKPESLSPLNSLNSDGKPRGRVWLDEMWAYRKLSQTELPSMALDYIANLELGVGKIDKKKVSELSIDELIRYNVGDVWLIKEIEKKKGIVEYFDAVRRISFCYWYDVFKNSRVLDFYFLKKAKEFGVVLPTAKKHGKEKIEGARVIEPKPGIHENVAVGDVRSLYPTAILTCNLSPETLDESGEIKVNNVQFKKEPRGFIPKVVKDLWDLRQAWKKKRDEFDVDSPDYKKWDNLQTVLKFLLNSVYGVLLYSNFRLYNKSVGESVTYFGRRANLWMEKKVKELGYEVIAGDTDSIFFKLKKKSLEEQIIEAKEVIDYVNGSLDEFCEREFGDATYNIMYIEFEKIYKRLFFARGDGDEAIKKRYSGLIVYKDGKILSEPKLEIKGFEAKRSDTPDLIKDLQKEIFKMVLHGEPKEKILRKLRKVRNMIVNGKISPEEIAIPKGMSKPIWEYKKSLPAHIAGAIYYNKHFGGNIKQEKVKYIYVKESPPGLPKTHVISFVDKCPDGFVFDWAKMAKLLIDDKFATLFKSLGWDIGEIQNFNLEKFLTDEEVTRK